jgi:hypothetical protein
MTIKIGNTTFYASMANRAANYVFSDPAVVANNGMGESQQAGGSRVEWTWAVLSITEYKWLTGTLLAGAASRVFAVSGGTTLYNDDGDEQTFGYCIVRKPIYKEFNGMYYRDVTLVIDTIL